jgi:hypothetical protein
VVSSASKFGRRALVSSAMRVTNSLPPLRKASTRTPGYFASKARDRALYESPANDVYQLTTASLLAPA